MRVTAVTVLLIAMLPASPAAAAHVVLRVARAQRLPQHRVFDARFRLGAGWQRARSPLNGQRLNGDFEQATPLGGGATCYLRLTVYARAQRDSHVGEDGFLRYDGTHERVVRKGTTARGRWYSGSSTAVAVLSLPAGVARPRMRLALAFFRLDRETQRFGPPGDDGYPVLSPTRRHYRRCRRLEEGRVWGRGPRAPGA